MKHAVSFVFTCLFFVCVLESQSAFAQRFTSSPQPKQSLTVDTSGDENAREAYLALKSGNLDDARKYLEGANSSNPFAIFVRAALTSDATEAAGMYKEIIAENPDQPITREALLQLYKYHFAAGDYGAAHTDYLELRKYPMVTQLIDPLGFKDSLQTQRTSVKPQVAQTSPPITTPSVEAGSFTVQVGVFSTPQNARRFVESLRSQGIGCTIFSKTEAGRTLYAVSAGSFSTRDSAEEFAADLKNRSIDCIIVQK